LLAVAFAASVLVSLFGIMAGMWWVAIEAGISVLVSACFQFSGVGKLFHAAEDLYYSVVASIDRNLHGIT
jgi:hypothetical protein